MSRACLSGRVGARAREHTPATGPHILPMYTPTFTHACTVSLCFTLASPARPQTQVRGAGAPGGQPAVTGGHGVPSALWTFLCVMLFVSRRACRSVAARRCPACAPPLPCRPSRHIAGAPHGLPKTVTLRPRQARPPHLHLPGGGGAWCWRRTASRPNPLFSLSPPQGSSMRAVV